MKISELYQVFLKHPVVTTDTRDCPKNSMFFALRGASFNGNDFAIKALESGCAYAVVDDERVVGDERLIHVPDVLTAMQELAAYHRRQLHTPILQVTGTNGKTTTKELTSAVLSERFNVLYTLGNFNNHIGVPKTLLRLRPEHDIAVVETGANHPGEIAELCRIVQADCVQPGEFVTIMGTSGSGKSTLLNVLGCLDIPTSGEYYLDGMSVREMGKNDRASYRNLKIGFIFQSYNLLPKTTALENVELPLLYNPSVSKRVRREKALSALKAVGLENRVNHRSNQMSGGQQQRVAIARAMVNDPVILLADEATGNLDTRTSYEILALFQRLHAEGRTIIFVTHNPEIAEFSSRNILLRDGRVVEDKINSRIGSARQVLESLPKESN